MSAEEFDRLLAALDPDPIRAVKAYEDLRKRYLTFFRLNRFSAEAPNLFDEMMDIAARRLSQVQVDNVSGYIKGIAKNVLFEAIRDRNRPRPEPLEDPSPDCLETERKDRELDCLNKCVMQLDLEDRALVLEYYKYSKAEKIESHRKMAAKAGITPGTLRVRAYRIRQKLEDCVKGCMALVSETKLRENHYKAGTSAVG